jgi:hypothetical protein
VPIEAFYEWKKLGPKAETALHRCSNSTSSSSIVNDKPSLTVYATGHRCGLSLHISDWETTPAPQKRGCAHSREVRVEQALRRSKESLS